MENLLNLLILLMSVDAWITHRFLTIPCNYSRRSRMRTSSRPLCSRLVTATINQIRGRTSKTSRASCLTAYQAGSAPFSVSDYFWQQAERAELSSKNAYGQWCAAIGPAVTTWTVYSEGSRSRLSYPRYGTVSCLRSGWPVIASKAFSTR